MSVTQYGNYKILFELGKGGMGVVYKGYDKVLDRDVAIKFLSIQSTDLMTKIKKFKQEARNQAKLSHPNIVSVYDFIQEEGSVGIVMEYVEGETLEHLIHRKIRLDLWESIDIIRQVMTGIEYAHSKGFLHLDIKPSNIIIGLNGVVKIMDFGISKSLFEKDINIARTNPGTLPYMSPELLNGGDPTVQSDVYSLGITFYEMLAGVTPFEADSQEEIINGHLKFQPVSLLKYAPELSSSVDQIVQLALAKNSINRFQQVKDFSDAIEQLYKNQKSGTNEPIKQIKYNKRKKVRAIIYTTLILLFAISMIYFLVDQIMRNWKTGKDILMLDNNSDLGIKKTGQTYSFVDTKIVKCPVIESLNSINVFNNFIYCSGDEGTLIKSSDNGNSWVKLTTNISSDLYDVAFTSENNGFAVGDSSIILFTSDGGRTWEKLRLEIDNSLLRIKFFNSTDGFILGNKGIILKTKNAGKNWLRLKSNSLSTFYDIDFVNGNIGYIVGKNGDLLKSTDKGENWFYQNQFTTGYLKSINFVNKYLGFIVGGDGNVFRTENSGETWSKCKQNIQSGLSDVSFVDNQKGVIVGAKGTILYSEDSGLEWKTNTPASFKTLNRTIKTNDGKLIAVGVNGTILKLSF